LVANAFGFVPPRGTTPPAPAIINHLQQLPRARALYIWSAVGGATGRLLAEKMPREVESVEFGRNVSVEDRSDALEALGAEREVGTVDVGRCGEGAVSLTQGGAFDGWGSEGFPAIDVILMEFEVPDDLEDAVAVISSGLTSLLTAGVRGLRRAVVWLAGPGDRVDAIRELLPNGVAVGDFDIITVNGWSAWRIGIRATRRY